MPIIPKHDTSSEGNTTSRMDAVVSEVLRESGNEKYIESVLQVLRAIAASKDDGELYSLVEKGNIKSDYLVLSDVIGNTICADLLDYIKRDHMMTGIRATYDARIFRYFGVGEHLFNGKKYKRVIIHLVKNGRVRNDALADLLDILKLRYNLSDKVLFHPKKCAADGMLIKAIAEAGLNEKDLLKYSDDGLLDALADRPLIKMIRSWELFKPVFLCGLGNINSFDEQHTKTDLIGKLHKELQLRTRIEKTIEQELGLPEGETSLLIFCPRPKMTLKPVRALVQWKDGTVRRLNEITAEDDPLTSKQIEVLQEIYPELWKLYLFVHPRLRSRGHEIQEKFCAVLKREAKLNVTCDPALQHYLEKSCFDYKMGYQLNEELQKTSTYNELPRERQLAVRAKCHSRLPADPSDDRYAEPQVEIVGSRADETASLTALREIISSVMSEHEPPPEKQGKLDIG